MQESILDGVIRRFVRKLDALQREKSGGVMIEDIIETMARTEITATGVAELVRSVYHDGIAFTGTSLNPADYNRPLILLWLNREHATVRSALANEPLPQTPVRTEPRTDIKFPIGTIEGEPLSETIIRERR